MSSLVSAGVSVTVTDESFYIPASAPTVPLLFIATAANKKQPNGTSSATGTTETGIVRTVTSLGQSTQFYGVPKFFADSSGNQFHGDARNEYGLVALNQYLAVGNLAYVIRANIDLSDSAETFIGAGVPVASGITLTGVGNGSISTVAVASAFVKPETIDIVLTSATEFTVQGSVSGIIGTGTVGTAFTSTKISFTVSAGSTAFSAGDYFQFSLVYSPSAYSGVGNGVMSAITPLTGAVAETISVILSSATSFVVSGSVSGPLGTGTVGSTFTDSFSHISFLVSTGSTAFTSGDEFQIVLSQINIFNPLGANDAARRVAIKTALIAEINSNTEIRSEMYEYNLILCPGYPETVESLLVLAETVNNEAFVIGDTYVNQTSEQVAAWANSTGRANSTNVAYYYPWGLGSNLDGTSIVIAPSGTALAVYANSDNMSYVWFAPAGASRGVVTGLDDIGYVTGTLGTATTFVPLHVNQGQRDSLYQDFTNINPIAYFTGRGILVWGQKTSASADSALNRVNVVRLICYIRRALRKGAFPFVFEPNDSITRGNLKAIADAFLNTIMAKRGLYDFVTLCDTSNNTSDIIANNELYMDVALKPTIAAEFIYIPITVLATGATMPS